MKTRYEYKDTVWVDLNQPTANEIQSVMEDFKVSPLVADELTSPSVKSRVELHKDYIYLILHFPAIRHSHGESSKQEVDFIIGKHFVITARYDTIDAIDKFGKVVEVNTILDRGFEKDCAGAMFFGILQEIYKSLLNELEFVEVWIGRIEQGIFGGKEKDMVVALSEVSRTLLNFKKATDFHGEILNRLNEYGKQVFDEHFSYHVSRVINEYSKVENSLKNNMESVEELRETNNSLVSTKQNEIMKNLTIMAFVTFPLTLIASIFSLNTSYIPLTGEKYDFWIVIGIMLFAMLLMFAFFKHKEWL